MRNFFALPRNRFDGILALVLLTFLSQVLISYRLWEPSLRKFPMVSYWEWLPLQWGDVFNSALFYLLIINTILIIIIKQKKWLIALWMGLLSVLILQDILRLQAWVYQYMLMLGVAAAHYQQPEKYSLGVWRCWQLLFIATYFWSGVHKLNPHFAADVYTWLMGIFEFSKPLAKYTLGGYVMAVAEIIFALGLFFPRWRRWALYGLLAMHSFILLFLIGDGWNLVVYPWNALMIVMGWLLFSKEPINNENTLRIGLFKPFYAFVFLCVFAPALHIVGYWQYNLSFTMYSGLCMEISVAIDDENGLDCIPRRYHKHFSPYSMTQSSLMLDDWTIDEMNVPMFPDEAIFRRTARHLCPCIGRFHGKIIFELPYRFKKETKLWEEGC